MGWLDVVPAAEASQEKPEIVGFPSSADVAAQREASSSWDLGFTNWLKSKFASKPETATANPTATTPSRDEAGLGDDLIRFLASFLTPEDQERLTEKRTEPERADKAIKAVIDTAAEHKNASTTLLAIKELLDKYGH